MKSAVLDQDVRERAGRIWVRRRELGLARRCLSIGLGAAIGMAALSSRSRALSLLGGAAALTLLFRGLSGRTLLAGAGVENEVPLLDIDALEAQIDATLADSFPASDPPSWTPIFRVGR